MSSESAENINIEEKGAEKQYRDILKYTGLFGGVQGLNMAAGIIRNKLTALILGTYGYGFISIYNSASALINNSTNLGISFSSVKDLSRIWHDEDEAAARDYVDVIRFWALLASLLGIIVCFLMAGYLSELSFGTAERINDFRILAFVVGLTTFSATELSILKAVRRISDVARISLYSAVSSIFIVIPVYYLLREDGIVPGLLLLAIGVAMITAYYTFRLYPLRRSIFDGSNLRKGIPLVKLGLSFIIAGVFGSGAEYLIRAYMSNVGGVDEVGLYNAGYAISVTYMGMIFVAMENDYFPKLSTLCDKVKERNSLMNSQIEVALWLISPMIAGLLLFMPVILPLLYSGKFLPAQDMILWTTMYMFFKALILPVAYLTLAKGDSIAYMILELIYDLFFVGISVLCYSVWGLKGLGISLSVAGFFDLILIGAFAYRRYGFVYSRRIVITVAVQLPFIIAMILLFQYERNIVSWIAGSLITAVIVSLSAYFLNKRTDIISKIMIRTGLKK